MHRHPRVRGCRGGEGPPVAGERDLIGLSWVTATGVVVTREVGTLLSLRHGEESPQTDRPADEEIRPTSGGEAR